MFGSPRNILQRSTYFIQNAVRIHTSIHTCMHTHTSIDSLIFSKTFILIYSIAEFISVTQAEVLSV